MPHEFQPFQILGFTVWGIVSVLLLVATLSLGRIRRTLPWYSLLLATLLCPVGLGAGIYSIVREWGANPAESMREDLLFVIIACSCAILSTILFLGSFIAQAVRFAQVHRRIRELETLCSAVTAEARDIGSRPSQS